MIEVFKTNVRRKNDAKRLLKIFNRHFNECKINFDLSDCDKVEWKGRMFVLIK